MGITMVQAVADMAIQPPDKILQSVPDLDGQLHKFDAQQVERSIEQSW